MIMPAIGENYVSPRIRFFIAFFLSVILVNTMKEVLIDPPEHIWQMAFIITIEVITGVFIGSIAKLVMSALHTAGSIIATNTGLASANLFDPNQGMQGSIEGNFLHSIVLVLLVIMDIHHEIIIGLTRSYYLFPIGQMIFLSDKVMYYTQTFSQIFNIAVQLASAHIIAGFLLFAGSGILSRLMPSLHIFFLMIPIQIYLGFTILSSILMYVVHQHLGKISQYIGHFT